MPFPPPRVDADVCVSHPGATRMGASPRGRRPAMDTGIRPGAPPGPGARAAGLGGPRLSRRRVSVASILRAHRASASAGTRPPPSLAAPTPNAQENVWPKARPPAGLRRRPRAARFSTSRPTSLPGWRGARPARSVALPAASREGSRGPPPVAGRDMRVGAPAPPRPPGPDVPQRRRSSLPSSRARTLSAAGRAGSARAAAACQRSRPSSSSSSPCRPPRSPAASV